MTIAPVARNDPCPCGSGQRYKHCHGVANAASAGTAPLPPPAASGPVSAAPSPEPVEAPEIATLRLQARAAPLPSAEPLWQALLHAVPGDPEALFGLGNAASARADHAVAAGHFEAAVAGEPLHAGLLNNLGLVYEKLDRLADAEACFRRALAVQPDGFAPIANLAQNLFQQARYAESVTYYDRLAPYTVDEPSFNANRGVCLAHVGRFADSEAALQRALALAPDRAVLHRDLALLAIKQQRWEDAGRELERAAITLGDDSMTLSMLDLARANLADWRHPADRALLMDRVRDAEAIGLPPLDPFPALAQTDDPAFQLAAARCWMRQPISVADAPMPVARPDPLRLGFVSSDFFNHPVTRLVLGLLEQIDSERFTVFAYSTVAHQDSPLRVRLRNAVDTFRDVSGRGPVEQAAAMRDDQIDILVDLNGFTGTQAVPIFAQRPASLQVNFLGYTGTLGSAVYDCIIADRHCIKPEDARWYSEEPLYVEPCYLPSDPLRVHGMPAATLARSDYGLPATGTVFAAWAAHYKINPALFDIWMRVLQQVPGSVLWLRAGTAQGQANLRREAVARGVDEQRLVFAQTDLLQGYFSRLALADLMLDTFPFGAHTTVNDALFMGVPVVALEGRSFASRASASQLRAAGLAELVATSPDAYAAIAVQLAADVTAVATRLRATVRTSPLFDMARYARGFEDALASAWRQRTQHALSGQPTAS